MCRPPILGLQCGPLSQAVSPRTDWSSPIRNSSYHTLILSGCTVFSPFYPSLPPHVYISVICKSGISGPVLSLDPFPSVGLGTDPIFGTVTLIPLVPSAGHILPLHSSTTGV